jgi:hypothetical protein
MYADGVESFQEQLSTALGVNIIGGLAASTDFKSRILWPTAQAGRPLLTFSPVTASSFLDRIKLYMLPEVSHRLSPDALLAIEQSTRGTSGLDELT